MRTKASLVVMSYLSDAQEMTAIGCPLTANSNINFAKYIILKCNGNLNQKIDSDTLWAEFVKTSHYKG